MMKRDVSELFKNNLYNDEYSHLHFQIFFVFIAKQDENHLKSRLSILNDLYTAVYCLDSSFYCFFKGLYRSIQTTSLLYLHHILYLLLCLYNYYLRRLASSFCRQYFFLIDVFLRIHE